ncbi:oligosaccharide flippase family protein [Roseomonas sp. AR75]|uniref:oligosaccharide flippase family protein n=1 Tax=Roseomonas sp. AR75 TaxID=2562311 RepID=UPI0010BFDD72|nr:oligosaccharide flippase family protein [Roseomonas sp. AR75]
MSEGEAGAKPLANVVLRGAVMMVALRFALRGIGLVSVFFTARLLTPADFGVLGTSAIVLGLFAILQSVGIGDALVRLRKLDADHVHTAWTINLIASLAVSACVWVTAPFAARVLEEPALVAVLRWQAFTPTLMALVSPGTMTFLRDFAFRKEFVLKVFQKVVVVVCVVTGAFLTRSYWGLVWGTMTGTALTVVMTYVLYPYRPRLSLAKHRDFLGFSFWTMMFSLASYAARVVDEVVVRRMVSTQVFGLYHTSRDLSRTLVSEMVAPASAALLPGLARLQDEPARFARAAQHMVGAGAIVAVAAGLGVSATAEEITGLLLGPKWAGAAAILQITAIGVAGQTLAGLHRSILIPLSKQHWSAALWALRAAVLAAVCVPAGAYGGVLAVAAAFAVTSVLMTILDYTLIFGHLGRPTAPVAIFLRPMLAGAAMMGVLALLPAGLPLLLSAVLKVAVGALTYTLVLWGAWFLAGRPNGAETALLHRLPARIGRLFLPRKQAAA